MNSSTATRQVRRGRAPVPTRKGAPAEASELSAVTREWLHGATLSSRVARGQFMTPRALREALLDQIPLWSGMKVLDPGVGTGEFLRSVLDREPQAICQGWDIDEEVLSYARRLVPGADLQVRSALDYWPGGDEFDLVIGNPPYFQFRASSSIRQQYAQVISGRPNIFALFFQAGLTVLRPGGRLAYVVPPSMNNGAYFDALRGYITRMGRVSWLRVYSEGQLFEDAQTAVQLIVVELAGGSSPHVFHREVPQAGFRRTIFAEQPELLEREFAGRSTIYDLGFEAVTGTVVWNQHRESLHADPGPGRVPLIWAENIVDGEVRLNTASRRLQYVSVERVLEGPAIVVNRIVGAVGAGTLRAGLVPSGVRFVGENHVNVVRPRKGVSPQVSWSELVQLLSDPGVLRRVVLLTGNTQLSATELTHLLPLG